MLLGLLLLCLGLATETRTWISMMPTMTLASSDKPRQGSRQPRQPTMQPKVQRHVLRLRRTSARPN
eukprot:2920239-Pyramimonas_sp.AAC.1